MVYPVIPLEVRLKRRLVEDENGCWIFQGCPKERYGKIKPGNNVRQSIGAHVAAYKCWVGDVPPGLVVRHKCDVPKCCNPDHLALGTQQQNVDDRTKRGRHWVRSGTEHYNYKHGKYAVSQQER
ncbi:HNH endonuclease [Mycobacterium phage Roksolana]|nr:HNH endonuclease [Mycobacterium phage Roksolana]